jgi:hypothetical protein
MARQNIYRARYESILAGLESRDAGGTTLGYAGFEYATRDITSGTTASQFVSQVLGDGPRAAGKVLRRLKPGAFGESEPDEEGPGGTANVGFVTGRCYFLVGNALRDTAEAAQLDAAPLAGATALYRREKRRCG